MDTEQKKVRQKEKVLLRQRSSVLDGREKDSKRRKKMKKTLLTAAGLVRDCGLTRRLVSLAFLWQVHVERIYLVAAHVANE